MSARHHLGTCRASPLQAARLPKSRGVPKRPSEEPLGSSSSVPAALRFPPAAGGVRSSPARLLAWKLCGARLPSSASRKVLQGREGEGCGHCKGWGTTGNCASSSGHENLQVTESGPPSPASKPQTNNKTKTKITNRKEKNHPQISQFSNKFENYCVLKIQ